MSCLGEQEGTGEGFLDQTREQKLDLGRRWEREGRKRAVTGGEQVLKMEWPEVGVGVVALAPNKGENRFKDGAYKGSCQGM